MLKLLKNFSYTVSSNLLNFIVIALVTLIIPKVIGVKEYGFWQLYIFYTNYVGVLHFGWIDGMYLKYGGLDYDELDSSYFKSQFSYFIVFESLVTVLIAAFGLIVDSGNNQFVVVSVGLYLLFYNGRQFFLYILQDTDRIREYAFNLILDRVVYVVWIVICLAVGVRSFKLLVVGDVISKIITLFIAIYSCRTIFRGKIQRLSVTIKEIYQNVNVGIKLLVANFASLLIVGIVRFGIKSTWGVTVFGKVSLTLSISNAMMLFVTAISLVLFPTLRRINKSLLPGLYDNFRQILILMLFACMFLYFPLNFLITRWLPNYQDSLKYLSFLFPMFIYEGKFELMVNTFMKTLRMERKLLLVNLTALATSVCVTAVNVFFVKNLNIIMLSIILILWFRSNLGEIVISSRLSLNVLRSIGVETLFVAIFICVTWFLSGLYAFAIFAVMFIVYGFTLRGRIHDSFDYVMNNLHA